MSSQEAKARFIEPMLLQRTQSLPEGPNWAYEVKLDGYRALAIKSNGKVLLRSRNNSDFNAKYPSAVRALAALPDETLIDGEVVALDSAGRPSFNALQNVGSSKVALVYYVFDVLILAGRDVMAEPLSKRRDLLQRRVLPKLSEPIRVSSQLTASLSELTKAVRAHGFEGIVARRQDSRYEPGQRSGAWLKMRVNQGQEFVIGGYTPGTGSFDALIFGYYQGDKLLRRQNSQWVHACHPGTTVSAFSGTGNSRVSVLELAGVNERSLGSRAHFRENEAMPVGEADAGGTVRILGVDSG
jgi:bifunctional non-homologous end joining protein LigD